MKTIEDFCTEAILLHKGRKIAAGETTEVIHHYDALASGIQAQRRNPNTDGGQRPDGDVGTDGEGGARIRSVELLDEHLNPLDTPPPPAAPPVVPFDSTITVRVHVEYLGAVKDSRVSIRLDNETNNVKVFSISTSNRLANTLEGLSLKEVEKGERVTVDFTFKVPLDNNLHTVTAAVRAGEDEERLVLDQVKAFALSIAKPEEGSLSGIVRLPTDIKIYAPQRERQGQSA
jgi:hypothetical protein